MGVTQVKVRQTLGLKAYHGVEAVGSLTFVDATHIFQVASITYWYYGVRYVTASPVSCDIDSFETLTINTLYFFYFDDASGTMKCSDSAWDLFLHVPVATVLWNGTEGAINYEAHGYKRDLIWHNWTHLSVGCRYIDGLSAVFPMDVDGSLRISSGEIHDEDLVFEIEEQGNCRRLYKASSTKYTWDISDYPYGGVGSVLQYLDTDTYSLTAVGASDFCCIWVYATTDTVRPIYLVLTHAATAYNTIAGARNETPPTLSGYNLSPEMKLLYKFIFKGNLAFQEMVDYRKDSSLPSGNVSSVSAAGVSFVPVGNIAAINVQAAIEEIDTEKAALAGALFTGYTRLGENAPTSKKLILTGTTNAAEDGTATINHGLNALKIISKSIIVQASSSALIFPNWTKTNGYQYDWYITDTACAVLNHATNSENILSKTFVIVLEYIA